CPLARLCLLSDTERARRNPVTMVAPTLSHLAATVTTAHPPRVEDTAEAAADPVGPQTFSQVRTALIRALRTSPDAREPLCDALELQEMIQQQLEQYGQAMPTNAENAKAWARARGKLQECRGQDTAHGQFLPEHRHDSSD